MSAISLTIKKPFYNRGVSLVEMILYIVLMTLVMGIIVQMLISISGIYRDIKLTRELESSGTVAMESMLREIRNASSVVLGESILGVSPGAIVVLSVDEDLNSYEMAFDAAEGTLRISKDSETPVALTSSSGVVSYLVFTRVTNANSEGVRIELEISGTAGSVSKSERFYGFAVLRGSY
ncbi:MAG: hypothetical protein V1896_02685 [Candidatus Zambryskibacteria bacterium]